MAHNMKAKCIKEFETKYKTFKPDEEIEVNEVNKDWFIVDAIGINKEIFKDYFIWKQ